MFDTFEIKDLLISNWGQYQGEYRGSWFVIPDDLSDDFNAFIKIDPYQKESFALAKLVCEPRDLWKQNEVDAIAYMFKQVLERIDGKK